MPLRSLFTLGLLLTATALPARAQDNREAFREVPREHWAYAALARTERSGTFTGFPEGTFRGKRALTRYELAVAVQRVAQTSSGPMQGWPDGTEGTLRERVLRKLNLTPATQVPELPRLITEFSAELRLLGGDPEQLQRQITRARAEAPKPAAPLQTAPRSKEYERGAKQARGDWEKGETVLYAGGLAPALTVDAKLGVPLYFALGCIFTPAQREFAQGHNEEVYRLTLERGLPANHRQRWLQDILQTREIWDDPARPRIVLRYGGPVLTSPDGRVSLGLKQEQPPRLEIADRDGKPLRWNLYRLDPQAPTVSVLWGPAGSHVLFLRYHEAESGQGGEVFQAIDTVLGRPLNRVYDPDPTPLSRVPDLSKQPALNASAPRPTP